MTETSRIFYEYPPTHASIHLQPKALGSLTPAKAKRSWGDLLKIPVRSKKDRDSSSRATIYAAGLNLAPINSYGSTPYIQQPQFRAPYQGHDFRRNYVADYRQKYVSGESYSPSRITPPPAPPVQSSNGNKSNLKNGTNSVRYTDWFGSVVGRKQPIRPSLQNLVQYNEPARGSYSGYNAPQTSPNVVEVPSVVPVQIYSNVCLCPDQLFSTKSKKRKKCKKCGFKTATIKNVTTTSTNRIRPAIPHNLYQAPSGVSWNWPHVQQSYGSQPYVVQPYLNGIRESGESASGTPETAESVKSEKSFDSNATQTRSNGSTGYTPSKIIPPPPSVPLPSIPSAPKNEKVTEKNSIISDGTTAYDLMERERRRSESSDTDDLSDNAINESFEVRLSNNHKDNKAKRVSIISIGEENTPTAKTNNVNITSSHSSNKEENKIKIYSNPTSNVCFPNGVPKSFPLSSKEESLSKDVQTSSKFERNAATPSSEIVSDGCDKNHEYNRQYKRRSKSSSSPSVPSLQGPSEMLNNNSSHVKKKSRSNSSRSVNNNSKAFDSEIPRRDESKVICIAGQRILFDKNLASKQRSLSNGNPDAFGIDSWETEKDNSWEANESNDTSNYQKRNEKSTESASKLDYRISSNSLRNGPITLNNSSRRNYLGNADQKKNSVSFRTTSTIHEEDENLNEEDAEERECQNQKSREGNQVLGVTNESHSEDESLESTPYYSSNLYNQECEDPEKEDKTSSSTSSPDQDGGFQPTLSELLQVKSILKRPNSVDTSSETDSDFYLPTFTEFKREQKKKKTVQFHPHREVTLVEHPEEFKDNEMSLAVGDEDNQDNESRNETPLENFEEDSNSYGSYTSSNSNFLQDEYQESKVSFNSQNEKTGDVVGERIYQENKDATLSQNPQDKRPTEANHSSRERQRIKQASSLKNPRLVKSNSLLQRGSSTPSRPTVPPPPPPPPSSTHAEKSKHASESLSINARNEYILRELSKSINSQSQSSHPPSPPETPPPPLPLSPPPPLPTPTSLNLDSKFGASGSFLTFSSFRDPKPDDSMSSRSSSTYSSQTLLPNYEAREDLSCFSNAPVFNLEDEEEHTATIRGRAKPSRLPIPSSMNFSSNASILSSNNQHSHPDGDFIQGSSSCPSSQSSSQKSFVSSMMEETDTEERFSDHIYEELPSLASSSITNNSDSPTQEKSIFDGASKYEILEFLQDAKRRVELDDDDTNCFPNEILESQLEAMRLDEEDEQGPSDCQEDSITPSRYKDGRSSNRSSNSDSSENSGLLRSDKERLPAGEIERTDSGVGSETSKPNLKIRKNGRSSLPTGGTHFNGNQSILRDRDLPPCDDCDSPVEAKVTNSGLMYAPLVCRRCSRRRQERKEIITEIMETEVKYGRDLRVMVEQFYRPMQIAALLSREQLSRIFLNIEDLIEHNRQFALQLKDAYEIAVDQGDEDLLTVNIAKLFLQASDMLHAFQNYCVRQSAASLLLQTLEKERELLRIFLKVSQMENTLLRRMNLHSFLMVPVQRITKYPLLLSRLFKATPQSHSSREDCRRAREKIELYLHHINSETKETSPTKLWRRISLSVGNNSPAKRPLQPPDYDTSLKLRAVALEVLEWRSEEAYVVREGRLQCLPPESNNWTRRGRGLKMAPVQVVLLTLGRPTSTLEEEIPEDGLVTPRDLGIREAAILAFKDNRISKSSLIRDPWLLTKNILSWDEEGETEFFEINDLFSKETYIFKDRDSVSTAEWFRLLQFHALAVGSWRRRRKALPNIMIHGAKRPSY